MQVIFYLSAYYIFPFLCNANIICPVKHFFKSSEEIIFLREGSEIIFKEEKVNRTSIRGEVTIGIDDLADPAEGGMGHYEVLLGPQSFYDLSISTTLN